MAAVGAKPARVSRAIAMPTTFWKQAVLVAIAFLIFEAIYALAAGWVAYQPGPLVHGVPLKHLALEQWRDGIFPLWSSMLGTGQPLLADSTSLPLDWRFLLFLPFSTLDGYIAATIVTRVAGAVITFGYLRRRLGAPGAPAFVGALLYLSSTSLIEEGSTLYSGLYAFPGLVWLSERLVDSVTPSRVLALGGAWALYLLMYGIGDVPYLAVGAFAWCLLYMRFRAGRLDRHVFHFAGAYAVAGAIGAALAAVTLLPTLELAEISNRGGEYPTEPYAVISLISAFVGTPRLSEPFPSIGYFYIGIISFAPIAVAIGRGGKNPYVRAAVVLALCSAVFLLAVFAAKQRLVDIFPSLATVGFSRAALLIGFAAAVLVTQGLREPTWRLGPRSHLVLGVLLAVQSFLLIGLGAGFLDFPDPWSLLPAAAALPFALIAIRVLGLGSALFQPSVPAPRLGGIELKRSAMVGSLLVLELLLVWGMARPMTNQAGYPVIPEIRFLQTHTGNQLRAMEILPRPLWKDELPGPRGLLLTQNAPAYSLIPTTNLYQSLINRDYSETFDDFGDLAFRRATYQQAPNSTMITTRYDSPLIRAFGVGYLYSASQFPQPRHSSLAFSRDDYYVYAVKNPLPRAFFAGRASWLPHQELHEQLRRIAADRPGRIHLGPEILIEGTKRTEGKPAYAPAEVTSDRGSSVEVSVLAPRPGFLVLSDVDSPGWSAEVDNRPTEIYKANGFARAVRVPAGNHTVEFHYAPASLSRGAVISAVAGVLCLLVLLVTSGHRRKRTGTAGTGTNRPRTVPPAR
jgi:Bacterial membrane protein YfhO